MVAKAVFLKRVPLMLMVSLAGACTLAGLAGMAQGSGGCPNRALVGFRASLPDCRAYEMVTPSYKEGFPFTVHEVSAEGLQLRIGSLGNLLSPDGAIPESTGELEHSYQVARTATGWESSPIDAPYSRFSDIEVLMQSPDFASSLWSTSPPEQSFDDPYLDLPYPAGLVRMGPGVPPGVVETALNPVGASEDLQRVLFSVHSPKVGLEEDRLWPGDATHGERLPSLYEYAGTGNSEPELVGVENQGTLAEAAQLQGKSHINEAAELISNCGTVLGSFPEGDAYNAVSQSGTTVFFSAEACGGGPPVSELYARVGQGSGKRTVAISEPSLTAPGRDCTTLTCEAAENVPGNREPGSFAGAALDGSTVFFTTGQPLVNADTDNSGDLYAETIAGGAVTGFAQVSRGGSGDPTPGSHAEVLGVARVSEDGSHVYFVARGALTGANGEGKSPKIGSPNLYMTVRECPGGGSACASPSERISFLATLSLADGADWSPTDKRPVQATPGGHFLVFESAADLTADQGEHEEAGQVFEYNAETERLARVSRGQDGLAEDGNSKTNAATIPVQNYELDAPDTHFTGLAVSADGSRVFFTSADGLAPQALAGLASVYEYHDEQVALVSDGHDLALLREVSATELIGTDESGEDVFFTTGDQLLPQDRNTWVDLYDARIDGGFPPPAVPAPCAGDSCQGAASVAPSLLAPGLAPAAPEAVAAEAVKPKAPPAKKKPRKPKKHKKSRKPKKHGHSVRGHGRSIAKTSGRGK